MTVRKRINKYRAGMSNPPAGKTERNIFTEELLRSMAVKKSLRDNIEMINSILGENIDFVIRELSLGKNEKIGGAVFYLDNLVDIDLLDKSILKPLLYEIRAIGLKGCDIVEELESGALISRAQMVKGDDFYEVVSSVLTGEVGLFIDNYPGVFIISSKGHKMRSVTEPGAENVVRGPREGFIEGLRVNISLIRRRLANPNLVFENIIIGKVSKTNVCLCYIKGLVYPRLVAEVRSRLYRIDIDAVLESGYIEELIEDNPFSPFPQVGNTERPDRVVAALLEGRVAILTDNSPVALIAPGELFSLLQASEDYYARYQIATVTRWLRYFAFISSLVIPSLYIAITNFHQEMIPTTLFISIAASRQGVPFPALVEALIMEISFEALREAGIRLPRPVGQAISIVGALVIGQAAVQAGIVSPLMVIVVALTGIASFIAPQYNIGIATRMLRFPLMLSAAFLGLFGVMAGLLTILLHLCSLRSFGVPYLSPLTPLHLEGLKDVLVRAPHWSLALRPDELVKKNRRRIKPEMIPGPPQESPEG